ncbi:hypothetical protein [Desulfococcus sp.]|uniref:hypothetical protein n=1 Tax=Desulfococcus sp. TaxID=2025834 RepID=UPI003593FFCF
MKRKSMKRIIYIAFRYYRDGAGIDLDTASWGKDIAMKKALRRNEEIPQWGAANPITHIGVFELKEVDR